MKKIQFIVFGLICYLGSTGFCYSGDVTFKIKTDRFDSDGEPIIAEFTIDAERLIGSSSDAEKLTILRPVNPNLWASKGDLARGLFYHPSDKKGRIIIYELETLAFGSKKEAQEFRNFFRNTDLPLVVDLTGDSNGKLNDNDKEFTIDLHHTNLHPAGGAVTLSYDEAMENPQHAHQVFEGAIDSTWRDIQQYAGSIPFFDKTKSGWKTTLWHHLPAVRLKLKPQRQLKIKSTSFAQVAFYTDRPFVGLHEFFGDKQSQPQSFWSAPL